MNWTRPLRPIGKAGESVLDRVLCVLGAVGLSQMPEFMQQYLQRLGGRLDEARRQLEEFERVAAQSKLTLTELVQRAASNTDEAMNRLGTVVQNSTARVEELTQAEAAIRNASLWSRPFVFFQNMDREIAASTWEIYKPAVPTTMEGAVYAGVGVVLALVLYHLVVRYPIECVWAARQKRKIAARAAST